MSWRDQYQKGSFRGAAFVTEQHQGQGGRRQVVHELPGAEEPVVEDMGRSSRRFGIDFFVVGADYFAARDALIAALEQKGPGTLIHPWHGQKRVSVEAFQWSESTEEGGICRFTVNFVEAGRADPVKVPADGKGLSISAANDVVGTASATFAGRFSVAGFPSFIEESAAHLVSGLATWTQLKARIGGGTGPALRAFEQGLAALGLAGLVRSPLALGHALVGLVQAVALLGGTPKRRIAAFTSMISYDPAASPIINGSSARRPSVFTVANAPTPARRQEAANRDALLHIYRVTASAELVRTIANGTFSSQDEAQATKSAVVDILDGLVVAAADIGEDDRAAEFEQLRRSLARDIAARTPQLPSLRDLTTHASEPAIVISNRLYGHELAEERAEDIVARNQLAHPAFVPDGATLKVIANG